MTEEEGSRIKLDQDLVKRLERIKEAEWKVRSGRGLTDTIRFLADHYEEYKDLHRILDLSLKEQAKVLDQRLEALPGDVIQDLRTRIWTFLSNPGDPKPGDSKIPLFMQPGSAASRREQ